ncbi:MAG: hypothetical protein LBD07_02515 [Spirochaetaceae bacterium]|jgi:ABC-type transporter Mla subunit MlaD|nr:hypothetical protein [Spirochaetaceae bacterium]
MREKIKLLILGSVFGVCTALVGSAIAGGSSAGEIARLTRRHDELNREYRERQRELASGLSECLGYVENARGIVERTGENAGRAISNLREASALIKQGIEERKNLEMELDSIRAGLYRLGGVGRDVSGQMNDELQ